jgi:hypothetical protein
MNVKVLAVLAVVIITAAAATLIRCSDPERKLALASVWAMVDAVEQRDQEALLFYVAPEYTDRLGHDQKTAVQRAIQEIEHIPDCRIELEGLSLDLDKKRKRAVVSFRPVFEGAVDESLKKHPKLGFDRGRRLILRLKKVAGIYLLERADMGYALSAGLE